MGRLKQPPPMTRFAAFLRAINVGGRTAKKEELRRAFESLGLDNVETFIASGNVIFETGSKAGLEKKIEAALKKILGYDVATFVRTLAEVSKIAGVSPFDEEADESRLYVGFASGKPAPSALAPLASADHAFHIAGREIYWLCRIPMSESKITNGTIEKKLGMPVTFRNRNTVQRIAEKWG
jgi:uncharacterized protein (DUF1697 family)